VRLDTGDEGVNAIWRRRCGNGVLRYVRECMRKCACTKKKKRQMRANVCVCRGNGPCRAPSRMRLGYGVPGSEWWVACLRDA
jgi:hypothetical protein